MGRALESASTAIVVGTPIDTMEDLFASCRVAGRLDNLIGAKNQEQNRPISICEDPVGGGASMWPQMQHYD